LTPDNSLSCLELLLNHSPTQQSNITFCVHRVDTWLRGTYLILFSVLGIEF
jgi:hypothetical protein